MITGTRVEWPVGWVCNRDTVLFLRSIHDNSAREREDVRPFPAVSAWFIFCLGPCAVSLSPIPSFIPIREEELRKARPREPNHKKDSGREQGNAKFALVPAGGKRTKKQERGTKKTTKTEEGGKESAFQLLAFHFHPRFVVSPCPSCIRRLFFWR